MASSVECTNIDITDTSTASQQFGDDSIFYILSRCGLNYVYEYNIETKSLRKLSNRPYLNRTDITKYKNSIYAVLGEHRRIPSDDALRYDIDKNSWTQFKVPFTKSFASVCTVDDQMFLFGGIDVNKDLTNTCARYDYQTDRWFDLPPMEGYRGNCDPILYNNGIYVLGGFSGSENDVVEILDPREGKWSKAGKITGGGSVCSAMMGNRICIMNNYTGKYCLYDPKSQHCTECTDATVFGRRGKQWLCNKGSKLYLLHYGGLDEYNETTGEFHNILSHQFVKCPFVM